MIFRPAVVSISFDLFRALRYNVAFMHKKQCLFGEAQIYSMSKVRK